MRKVRVIMLDVLSPTYNRRGVLLTSNSVLTYFECRSVQEIYLQISICTRNLFANRGDRQLLNYKDSYLCNGQIDSQFASLPVCQPANLSVNQFSTGSLIASLPVCQSASLSAIQFVSQPSFQPPSMPAGWQPYILIGRQRVGKNGDNPISPRGQPLAINRRKANQSVR